MKKVLISGGAGGIGSAIVKKFVDSGYFVYVIDTDVCANQILMNTYGSKIKVFCADVTDPHALKKCAQQVDDIHHIITLAGRALEGEWVDFEDLSCNLIEQSVRLNLVGHINVVHTFFQALKKAQGDRSILLMSSINAFQCHDLAAYSAAKAGLFGFVSAMVRQFGKLGIRINTISPGTVITPATTAEPKDFQALRMTSAMDRFATTDEVADMAHAVCETFVSSTGQNFVVDAGQSRV